MKKKIGVLKLVDTKVTAKTGDLFFNILFGLGILKQDNPPFAANKMLPFIVTTDDIKEGDWVLGGEGDEAEGEFWQWDGISYLGIDDVKIVILPKQFTDAMLVKICKGELNHGDAVSYTLNKKEIEIEALKDLNFDSIEYEEVNPIDKSIELPHFWYHVGAADGIVSSLSGKKTPFESRLKEFPEAAKYYTEEDVYKLLQKLNTRDEHGMLESNLKEWFEENKK